MVETITFEFVAVIRDKVGEMVGFNAEFAETEEKLAQKCGLSGESSLWLGGRVRRRNNPKRKFKNIKMHYFQREKTDIRTQKQKSFQLEVKRLSNTTHRWEKFLHLLRPYFGKGTPCWRNPNLNSTSQRLN